MAIDPGGVSRKLQGNEVGTPIFDQQLPDTTAKKTVSPPTNEVVWQQYAFNDQPWNPEGRTATDASPKEQMPKLDGKDAQQQSWWPKWLRWGVLLGGAVELTDRDRQRETNALQGAFEKFGLDSTSKTDQLAARAYLWGKHIAPRTYWAVDLEGAVNGNNERVAIAIMRNEQANPGTLGRAVNTGDKDALALLDSVIQNAVGGNDPTIKPNLPAPPTEIKEGWAFEIRNREEGDLIATMQAQGKSPLEIQIALENLRRSRGEEITATGAPKISDANDAIAERAGLIDESRSKFSDEERKIAQWFSERGYDVAAIPRQPGVKTPDAEITKDGVTQQVEFKTINADRVETIMSKATKGVKQGNNIVIDTRSLNTKEQTALEALARLSGNDKLSNGTTVTIIGNNFSLKLTK